jgi:hypothetical protein
MTKKEKKQLVTERFERYSKDATTVARQFKVPRTVIDGIAGLVPMYGSQGRALQVGTEILLRLRKPIKIDGACLEAVTRKTFKILPRTAELIDALAKTYGDECRVFAACLEVLTGTYKL